MGQEGATLHPMFIHSRNWRDQPKKRRAPESRKCPCHDTGWNLKIPPYHMVLVVSA